MKENVEVLNESLDGKIKAYSDDTRIIASRISDAITEISQKISLQITVINAGDRANNHSVAEIINSCVDPINFNDLTNSPFFLGYKGDDGRNHYLWFNRNFLHGVWFDNKGQADEVWFDRKRVIEELYRFSVFGLDMDGIKPEYM